jgi:hypothetical protein
VDTNSVHKNAGFFPEEVKDGCREKDCSPYTRHKGGMQEVQVFNF